MTKQEEIREGIYALFSGCFTNMTGKLPNEEEMGWLNAYTEQMQVYLHSQGVVIKVDRELPVMPRDWYGYGDVNSTYKAGRESLLKADFGAFENLIEK